MAVCAPGWGALFPSNVTDLNAADNVQLTWGVKIPLRDGVNLSATL